MESHDRISTGTDVLSASSGWYLNLIVGDRITLMYMNEDSNGDTTTLSAHIKCLMVMLRSSYTKKIIVKLNVF